MIGLFNVRLAGRTLRVDVTCNTVSLYAENGQELDWKISESDWNTILAAARGRGLDPQDWRYADGAPTTAVQAPPDPERTGTARSLSFILDMHCVIPIVRDGQHVATLPRYGVWIWDPRDKRHRCRDTGDDLGELAKLYSIPESRVFSLPPNLLPPSTTEARFLSQS